MSGCPTLAEFLFLRLGWEHQNTVILSDRTLSLSKGQGVEGPAFVFRWPHNNAPCPILATCFCRKGGIARCPQHRTSYKRPIRAPTSLLHWIRDHRAHFRAPDRVLIETRYLSPARLKFMSELNENKNVAATSLRLKVGLAEMLKGGVIMDVMNVEQARIAEESAPHPSWLSSACPP